MKRRIRLFAAVLLAAAIPALAAGCTTSRDIKQLAIVEGVGIDLNADGNYLLTFQVYKPQSGGGTQSGKQGATNKTDIMQISGRSLFDASRNCTLQMGKKLYYSNTRVLILGEEICRQGFLKVMDFLERNSDIKPGQRILMANGRAEDILTAKNEDGYISAQDIELILRNNYNTSKIVDVQLQDIENDLSLGIKDTSIARVSVKHTNTSAASSTQSGTSEQRGKDVLTIDGTAYFNEGKLAGVLDNLQTRGLLWLMGEVKSGVIVADTGSGNVSFEIISSAASVKTVKQGGVVGIEADVRFKTHISEVQAADIKDMSMPVIERLTELQNRKVREEIEGAVGAALRQHNSDIFGFGQTIYRSDPEAWKKLEKQWDKDASKLPVKINVTSTIENYGVITR